MNSSIKFSDLLCAKSSENLSTNARNGVANYAPIFIC